MGASLFVIQGSDQGRRFDLPAAPAVLGRETRNPVRLHDDEVSRRHAEIRPLPAGEGYEILDLDSANGTFLNGKPVARAALRHGDQIRLGKTVLLFNDPAARNDRELRSRVDVLPPGQPLERTAFLRSLPAADEPSRILAESDPDRPSNLTNVLDAILAINQTLDIEPLLARVLQIAFDATLAHRGAVLLKNPDDNRVEVRSARWRGKLDPDERLAISRTVVDHVLERRQGLWTADAPDDTRLDASRSIRRYGIVEIIAVPLRGRNDVLGVLYVDHRSSPAAPARNARGEVVPMQTRFTAEHLKLMVAVGHYAGLAVENSLLNEAKLQAERLAAVGQTIAVLSHHVKNILQGVRGGSFLVESALKSSPPDEAALRKGWAVVEKNQNKIYNLVMDMLSFSKEREPALEPNRLNETVADIVELMRPRAEELGVRIAWNPAPGLPETLYDADGVHRAVLNLVSNAIDALHGADVPQPAVEVSTDFDEQRVRVRVADNGVGIPESELEAIFQLFQSTKGSRGTGLGLPVSDKIAREHGGSIKVESAPGKGARFTLEIPLRKIEDSEIRHREPDEPSPAPEPGIETRS